MTGNGMWIDVDCVDCGLCGLRIVDCVDNGLWVMDCGLWVVDYGCGSRSRSGGWAMKVDGGL